MEDFETAMQLTKDIFDIVNSECVESVQDGDWTIINGGCPKARKKLASLISDMHDVGYWLKEDIDDNCPSGFPWKGRILNKPVRVEFKRYLIERRDNGYRYVMASQYDLRVGDIVICMPSFTKEVFGRVVRCDVSIPESYQGYAIYPCSPLSKERIKEAGFVLGSDNSIVSAPDYWYDGAFCDQDDIEQMPNVFFEDLIKAARYAERYQSDSKMCWRE